MSEMWYTYWLACVEGITGDRKCELCRKNGSAEAVYYIEEKDERRKKTGLSSFFARRKKQETKYANGIRIGARRLRTISIYIIGAVISTTVCYIIASLLNFRALIKATGVRPDCPVSQADGQNTGRYQ